MGVLRMSSPPVFSAGLVWSSWLRSWTSHWTLPNIAYMFACSLWVSLLSQLAGGTLLADRRPDNNCLWPGFCGKIWLMLCWRSCRHPCPGPGADHHCPHCLDTACSQLFGGSWIISRYGSIPSNIPLFGLYLNPTSNIDLHSVFLNNYRYIPKKIYAKLNRKIHKIIDPVEP